MGPFQTRTKRAQSVTDLTEKNHEERFHEYGESFELYPCEQCGFKGSTIVSIRRHISEIHDSIETNCVSLEELGISRIPEVTTRRKHNFSDLIINDDGDIDVDDEETDENFNLSSEDVNLNESPIRKSSKRKITSVVSPKKKRRLVEESPKFVCEICNITFTLKHNMTRRNKRKH